MDTGQTKDTGKGLRNFLHTLLSHRRFPFVVAILAILLTLPALNVGLIVDDYHHKSLMQGPDSQFRLLNSPIDMFRFFDGDPQRTAEMMDYGFTPWWTYKGIKAAFWRPLTSITHWLDYLLWPDSPFLMHAQSIFWYGLLAMAAAFLYRRFATIGWIAGLAALLFAIDDAHGTPVGFLSNRNAVLAAVFGILVLIVHDQWRRNGRRSGIALGPLLLAASLLSAEGGIATCAYLAAYAMFIDRDRFVRRFTALIPYVAVVVIWRCLWTYLGYGVAGVGAYVDPLGEPLRYLSAVIDRAPFLLLGQWAVPPSDITMMFSPKVVNPLWRGACLFLVFVAVMFAGLLKQSRTARFWTAGMLLSVLPICATFPHDRLLVFVGIGAMGLISEFIAFVFTKNQERPKLLLWRIPATLLAALLILIHLIIAPLALPLRAATPMAPKKLTDRLRINKPFDPSIENQDLIIVNPPTAFLTLTSLLIWQANDQPLPRHTRILTASLLRPVKIYRPDEKTLVVRPEYGCYAWVWDKLFRNEQHPFTIGERVELTGMSVTVTELTGDGRPAEAAFTFSVGLEDPSLHWLQYKNGSFVPFNPPAVGGRVEIAGSEPFWK